ncbi:MAG: TonB-dependent receptor plug domain-containing protein [Bacteroidota bacterium]
MNINKSLLQSVGTLLLLFCITLGYAQEPQKEYSEMTKEEVLQMSYDQLLELPLEDLMALANIVGVSADELLNMILNMEVSTASKKAESVFESPLSTSVVTKEEILNSGASNIPEVLRLVPGMIVRQKSNGNYDVHIRGLDNVPPGNFTHFSENSLTLVMIDNRIVYNHINGGTFWESLPISLIDIDRIDIIRGPSSALYGPNAVSGVINIITKKGASDDYHVQADVRYGSANTQLASINTSGNIAKGLDFRVSGNYEYRDRFQKDYYTYALGEYAHKDQVVSVFGYPYSGRGTLPTPDKAMDKWGINGNLYYEPNEDVNVRTSFGHQRSEAQTIFFENLATPFANRESNTTYGDIAGEVKGFSFQVSYMQGVQDLSVGMNKPVIKYDMNSLNANLEYTYELTDRFSLRPGISFQQAVYDDGKYVKEAQETDPNRQGLLNGEQSLQNFGGSLRADWSATEKLRFIAALRVDQYDKPDDLYFSYQLVSSYTLNEDHLLRAVYSRANRGAFIGSIYANFKNPVIYARDVNDPTVQNLIGLGLLDAEEPLYYQYYIGNQELNLLTMDMVEIGHRWKVSDKVQTDVEIFYSKTKDFDALLSSRFEKEPHPVLGPEAITHEYRTYKNLDIEAIQTGVSAAISYMPSNKAIFRLYGTWQQTSLTDFVPDETQPNAKEDIDHEWTPAFYGGFTANIMPVEKLSIYANVYFTSEQTYSRYVSPQNNPLETGTDKLDANASFHLNVSYKFWEENAVFVSAQNLLNGNNREFGFADSVEDLYMLGLRLQF